MLALTLLALDARVVLNRLDTELQLMSANLTAITLQTVSAEKAVQQTATEQGVYWKATSLQTSRLIGQARHAMTDLQETIQASNRLIAHTDTSLNGDTGAIQALGRAADHLDDSQAQIRDAIVPSLNAATLSLNRTADLIGDPAIREALQDTAGTAKNVQGITAHADHLIGWADQKVTQPLTFWQTVKSALWFPIKLAVKVW